MLTRLVSVGQRPCMRTLHATNILLVETPPSANQTRHVASMRKSVFVLRMRAWHSWKRSSIQMHDLILVKMVVTTLAFLLLVLQRMRCMINDRELENRTCGS
ncbi:hypothetical protein BCR37DRAFT_1634 [Protomyces lactucae-debilis]|uniref:Uncharacterized protein n=1 Tax=Protomyces lactucae-debilis TaxID=2754530 RepID=A0A1Y2FY50_PROLT|nr:uncharacterized protein BCR37DRAFT_1634 [Protomyces lactucae-debilis]ORY87595.1 hypothetical protein BCR37DRAFT_1634 [Protomyces lactucae-debilis]